MSVVLWTSLTVAVAVNKEESVCSALVVAASAAVSAAMAAEVAAMVLTLLSSHLQFCFAPPIWPLEVTVWMVVVLFATVMV